MKHLALATVFVAATAFYASFWWFVSSDERVNWAMQNVIPITCALTVGLAVGALVLFWEDLG